VDSSTSQGVNWAMSKKKNGGGEETEKGAGHRLVGHMVADDTGRQYSDLTRVSARRNIGRKRTDNGSSGAVPECF
jgi:hypothetical protein